MESDSLRARIEHEIVELRALYPQITSCHPAMVGWKEGGERHYSLHLDIRAPQHQLIVSGPARDDNYAALQAGFAAARERMKLVAPRLMREV